MSGPIATSSHPSQGTRQAGRLPGGPSASVGSAPANLGAVRNGRVGAPEPTSTQRPTAAPSHTDAAPVPHCALQDDPVRAAQDQATKVWRRDMRRLLERAEERFADVCWTTAAPDILDQPALDSDLGHDAFADSESSCHHGSQAEHIVSRQSFHESHPSFIPDLSAPPASLIWAHKAILYARAPNSFQTRFLNLRSPAAQLQHIGSTPSLASLPLHQSESQSSLASNFSNSTQTGAPLSDANTPSVPAGILAKPRKSIRSAAPPSSFSMTRPSLRKPISRSSISRPLRRASIDEAGSTTSGFITSDSEGEGGPATTLSASGLIIVRPPTAVEPSSLTSPSKLSQTSSSITHSSHAQARKLSFASVSSAAGSQSIGPRSVLSDASTLRAPISLRGVSQAFFEATLQYLYTGEEAMVDAFEFLFEDRLASDSEASPEEKVDKLRSDLTFMWRSKLYSDVKLVLDDQDDSDDTDVASLHARTQRRRAATKMLDIPDANMSVVSLPQTIDTDRLDESDDDDDELTSFSAHRMILASRSQYFASLLLSPYADARAPVLHLPSPPFTPASLHFTLGFLYTGTLFFSNRTFDLSTAFSLWRAGAYLQIETLQALVAALIDREFCHGFTCSPPCRKCVKRVPRTLVFATSPDVSEQALQDSAIAAVSGPHFGMYWAKDVGSLDPILQDRIVDAISDRLSKDPTLVVSVLRQLSIVGQRIDTERSSRWVESLRLMAETVENRLMPILQTNLDKIVQSPTYSDLLDGVGSLGDVLEKCLVMLVDGLTETRAAQIYQILVGQVLLREQGFEVPQSRHAVENARASILRYLKKRWINVRALSGFNKLEKWCLKELADELDVTTTDLVLPEEAPAKVATPPSRLLAGRMTSSLGGTAAAGTSARAVVPRSSLGVAAPSRLPTASTSSRTSNGSATSPMRNVPKGDGEREAGPIHMRAAVLNRNAARTSVANGHRTLSTASTASTSSATARPSPNAASTSNTKVAVSPAPNGSKVTAATPTRANGVNGSSARSATLSIATASRQRLRTTSGTSVSSVVSTRSVNVRTADTSVSKASTSRDQDVKPRTSRTTAEKAVTPKRSTARLTTPEDADKTPTKSIRSIPSATIVSPRTGEAKHATSVDAAIVKSKPPTLNHKSSFLRATPGPGGTFSLTSTNSGRDLRAQAVSAGSGAGSKKSTSETGAKSTASAAGRRSVTPTKSTRKLSTSSTGSAKAIVAGKAAAMPAFALANVRNAQQATSLPVSVERLPQSDSAKTIVYHPPPDSQARYPNDRVGGIRLIIGIPCIVSLSLPSTSPSMLRKPAAPVQQRSRPGQSTITSRNIPSKASSTSSVSPRGGGGKKFRALVKYMGPVEGVKGMWVGVQLHLPPTIAHSLGSKASTDKRMLRLQDGCFNGVRYFPLRGTCEVEGKTEAQHRVERRRELWRALSPNSPFPTSHKETEGHVGKMHEDEATRGGAMVELFVRPDDVVWVIQ